MNKNSHYLITNERRAIHLFVSLLLTVRYNRFLV